MSSTDIGALFGEETVTEASEASEQSLSDQIISSISQIDSAVEQIGVRFAQYDHLIHNNIYPYLREMGLRLAVAEDLIKIMIDENPKIKEIYEQKLSEAVAEAQENEPASHEAK